ncbi:MAG TPA: sugar transferase [Solirubrobacterales bacterium]|nr:sugar transferase [Solirubrobacterales bacterium]
MEGETGLMESGTVSGGISGELQTPARVDRLVASRHRDRDYGLRRFLFLADTLALFSSLELALWVVGDRRGQPEVDALWIVPTILVWFLLLRAYGLYQRPLRKFEPTHLDDVSSVFHALVIGTLGLWVWFRFMPVQRLGLEDVIAFGVFAFLLLISFRAAVRIIGLRLRGPERVLVIAPLADVKILQRKFGNHPEYEMEVVSAMTVAGEGHEGLDLDICEDFDDVGHMLRAGEVDHLIVQLNQTLISQEEIAELMRTCHRARIRFGTFPREKSLLPPGVDVNHVEGTGFLSYHPPVLSRSSQVIKRAMDLAITVPLLILCAIPMAIIALVIKLDDGGDFLFSQTRVGRDGERFQLLKFRTMIPDADALVAELMAKSLDPDWLVMEDDPRITRAGRFLRRSSLDELPQLWNVVRGDMSLVGPRPLPIRDDEAVRGWGRHRLDCIPGVTGWWQVLGRNDIPFREMVEIDYAYVTSWTFWGDVKLLARTVPVVLSRRGSN